MRSHEYKYLSELTLDGKILDVGGSKISGYHELIKGEHDYTVINIDDTYKPDIFVDIEKKFPFEDNTFDHAVCLNVLEHIFEYENAIKETVRVIRPGGVFAIGVPMIHHIHGSPDDYFRYTDSALRRVLDKNGCEIEKIENLGSGFFSLGFQCFGNVIPTDFIRNCAKHTFVNIDKLLSRVSGKYRKLSERLPLGYFVVAKKKTSN